MGTPPGKVSCMHMCSTTTCILEKQCRFLGALLYYIYTGKVSWCFSTVILEKVLGCSTTILEKVFGCSTIIALKWLVSLMVHKN